MNLNIIDDRIERVKAGSAGVVYTISRQLGPGSTLSLVAGTNPNLSLSGTAITAAAAIPAGVTQEAIVFEETARRAVKYAVAIVGAGGVTSLPSSIFAINDNVIADSRFELPLARVPVLRYNGHVSYQVSPPWAIVCPRVLFFGFYGAATAVGNDAPLEGLFIEVNGTKYWLSGNGSKTTSAATSFIVPNDLHKWTDDLDRSQIYIPPNADIRFGVAYDMGSEGKYLPQSTAIQPASLWKSALGYGDMGNQGNTLGSRLPVIAGNTTGIQVGGFGFGNFPGAPVCWTGKPATPQDAAIAKAVMIGGMSIDSGAWDTASPYGADPAHGMNAGGFARGLYSASGGRIPRAKMAIPGSRARDITNGGDPNSIAVSGGWARREAAFAEVGFPWSTALFGAPINDIASYALADTLANLEAAAAAMKGRGNRRVVVTTARPQTVSLTEGTSAANGYMYTGGDANQVRGSDTVHAAIDAALMAGTVANVDAVIDIRPAHESSPGSRKWKQGATTALAEGLYGPPSGIVASIANGTGGNGSVMTVTAITSGTLAVSQQITGTGILANNRPRILSQISGTPGGIGDYQLSSTVAVIASQSFTVGGQNQISLATKVADGDTLAISPRAAAWPNGNQDAPIVIVSTTVSTSAPFVYPILAPVKVDAGSSVAIVIYSSDGTHNSRLACVEESKVIEQAKISGAIR